MRNKRAKDIRKQALAIWELNYVKEIKNIWYDNFSQLYRKMKKQYTKRNMRY